MRFPQEKIREFLVHPDADLRQRAASYVSSSIPPDPEAMRLTIQGVETFGRDEMDEVLALAGSFAQTHATVDWIIRELNTGEPENEEDYFSRLSVILAELAPPLLRVRSAEILQCRALDPAIRKWLPRRLELLSWDAEKCWRELEKFSANASNEEDEETEDDTIGLEGAYGIAEAAAEHGTELEPKVRAVLRDALSQREDMSFEYLWPLAIRLAGRARLESTVPELVELLDLDDSDDMGLEAFDALSRIATAEVVHALGALGQRLAIVSARGVRDSPRDSRRRGGGAVSPTGAPSAHSRGSDSARSDSSFGVCVGRRRGCPGSAAQGRAKTGRAEAAEPSAGDLRDHRSAVPGVRGVAGARENGAGGL